MLNITEARERAKPRDRARRSVAYANIPFEMCFKPMSHDLSPFALSLFGVLCALARIKHADNNHALAYEAGKLAIDQELDLRDLFANTWKAVNKARRKGIHAQAPTRDHVVELGNVRRRYKPMKVKKALSSAGSSVYATSKAELRKQPMPETVRLETSVLQLLRDMRLSNSGRNFTNLDDALATLSKPIRFGQYEGDPLISIRRLSTGRMIIKVSGKWADVHYERVPLPLPIKSPLATKLLLWLRCVKPTNGYKEGGEIKFDTLCKCFGVKTRERWLRSRDFVRAVETINFEYLHKVDREALRKTNIKMPAAYDIEIVDESGLAVYFIDHPDLTAELDYRKRVHERAKQKRRKAAKPKKRRVRIVDPDFDELGFRESRFGKGFAESVLDGIGLDREQRLAMAARREQYRRSQELRKQYPL